MHDINWELFTREEKLLIKEVIKDGKAEKIMSVFEPRNPAQEGQIAKLVDSLVKREVLEASTVRKALQEVTADPAFTFMPSIESAWEELLKKELAGEDVSADLKKLIKVTASAEELDAAPPAPVVEKKEKVVPVKEEKVVPLKEGTEDDLFEGKPAKAVKTRSEKRREKLQKSK